MSSQAGPDQQTLQCMEIWGGIEPVERTVTTPGLDLWVFSQPFGGDEQGGDVYYVTLCGGGLITRIVVADVSGHGSSVAEFSLIAAVAACARTSIRRVKAGWSSGSTGSSPRWPRCAGSRRRSWSLTWRPPIELSVCNAGHPRPLYSIGPADGSGRCSHPKAVGDRTARTCRWASTKRPATRRSS